LLCQFFNKFFARRNAWQTFYWRHQAGKLGRFGKWFSSFNTFRYIFGQFPRIEHFNKMSVTASEPSHTNGEPALRRKCFKPLRLIRNVLEVMQRDAIVPTE